MGFEDCLCMGLFDGVEVGEGEYFISIWAHCLFWGFFLNVWALNVG